MNVDIEGHSDAVGVAAYKMALSEQRVKSVAAWLADNDTEVSRLNAAAAAILYLSRPTARQMNAPLKDKSRCGFLKARL